MNTTERGIDMHEMTQHYLIAALWTDTDNTDEQGGEPLENTYLITDFAPKAIEQAEADCQKFMTDNAKDLEYWTYEQAGHDFWLTRNHHGAGFWDRGKGLPGKRLTKAAHAFKELRAIVGDDGYIYLEG